MALDLKVSAPRAVFVRGKGLDAEVEGNLNVTGTTANPVVTGGLSLRRGTYTLLGRPLRFTRANITFVNANRIEPALDLLATTRSGDISIEIAITGTASEPKIALTSTPQLPQDEIMARFLFNKGAAELGPSELVQVVQAIAELTGNDSSGGAIDSARRALGLDRLNIGKSDTQGTNAGGNGVSGAGVEGGRYIAPGVYVGGRQGLQGDTRGVVQIEVIPHVRSKGSSAPTPPAAPASRWSTTTDDQTTTFTMRLGTTTTFFGGLPAMARCVSGIASAAASAACLPASFGNRSVARSLPLT
jgi:translocation and assembly module TamB